MCLGSSEDLGQEELFVSPTDSELALKLAISNQKLTLKSAKNLTVSNLCVQNEDSNSVLFVDTVSSNNSHNFLEKLLKGEIDEKDSKSFENFLSENNKYDLMAAIELFCQRLINLKVAGQKVTFILRCFDDQFNLHPLEVVFLTQLQSHFVIKFSDDSSDVDISKLVASHKIGSSYLKELNEKHLALYSVWVSYLTLLVNSRCELSLARTLNVPDRELDPSVFKALKKSAYEKEMPMFQTALSLITQVRLGGKGYRPSSKSSILQHVKGLGEFVDFIDRLRSHLEDYNLSPKIAIKRVLQSLQREFVSSKRSRELWPFVDCVYSELWKCLKEICALNLVAPSPKTPNSGGTLAGRESFKLLHRMVIKLNVIHSLRSVTSMDFGSDKSKLSHTPILEAFKSPAVAMTLEKAIKDCVKKAEDDKVENEENNKHTKTPLKGSRRSQQEMNWAKTPETPFFGAKDVNFTDEDENSRLSLDFGQDNQQEAIEDIEDELTESVLEKTIVCEEFVNAEPDFDEKSNSVPDTVPQKDVTKTAKRKKLEAKIVPEQENKTGCKENVSAQVTKKPKIETTGKKSENKPKGKKTTKKTLEPVKGQKTLGMFFK